MENIILSLLLMRHMTIYELKNYIHRNLDTICSDSLGSIQTAIKKLLSRDCITVNELVENSVLKKEYRITEKGFQQFVAWIETPIDSHKAKNMEAGKFFFLGIASKEARIQSLKKLIQSLTEEHEKLCMIQKQVTGIKEGVIKTNEERIAKETDLANYLLEVSGENNLETVLENVFNYQIYHLEYGLQRIQEDILFYHGILKKEEENEEFHRKNQEN